MLRSLLIAFSLLVGLPAYAHEPRIGPHGGLLVDAGAHHVEVVVSGATLDVYVSDAKDTPVPATGFKGVAILVANGKSVRIPLEAQQPDKLTGANSPGVDRALKGVIQLTGPDGKTATARLGQ